MIFGRKYRIYPNNFQKEYLEKCFGCNRFVFNHFLGLKNTMYRDDKKSLSCYEMINELPKLKQENEWLKEVPSQLLQMSLRNLDNAFTNFFRKQSKYPRFKSKKNNTKSFQLPQGVLIDNNKLYIPKLKTGIKIKLHRDINGKIKTSTIIKTCCDEYYVSFTIENKDKEVEKEEFNPKTTIGIDLGLTEFATISNGTEIKNYRYFKKTEKKLKIEQQKLCRCEKGSKNREKQRKKVAKVHNKISNQRSDFLHKETYKLTHDSQVSTICIEDLNVKGMIRNHKLAKSIADVSWREFRNLLEYKCNRYGKNLIVISRFAPSSKLCRVCGYIKKDLTLEDREWICPVCNTKHNRDKNASENIKTFGIEQYYRNLQN